MVPDANIQRVRNTATKGSRKAVPANIGLDSRAIIGRREVRCLHFVEEGRMGQVQGEPLPVQSHK